MQSVTSVDALSSNVPDGAKYLYWVSTAFVLGTSIHVLIITSFISVFGPGLALRGPEGSMVRDVEGMYQEQKMILSTYIIMIVSFALSIIGMFWIVMTDAAAVICICLFMFMAFYWYYCCIRIYNRFKVIDINFINHFLLIFINFY